MLYTSRHRMQTALENKGLQSISQSIQDEEGSLTRHPISNRKITNNIIIIRFKFWNLICAIFIRKLIWRHTPSEIQYSDVLIMLIFLIWIILCVNDNYCWNTGIGMMNGNVKQQKYCSVNLHWLCVALLLWTICTIQLTSQCIFCFQFCICSSKFKSGNQNHSTRGYKI